MTAPGRSPAPGHHSCEGLPFSISSCVPCPRASGVLKTELLGKDCPSSSSRRLSARPLCPSETLELPGTDSPSSQTMCSSYITSSKNNASLCPGQALELQEQHRRPATQRASTWYSHLELQHSPLISTQGHTSPGVQKPCQA